MPNMRNLCSIKYKGRFVSKAKHEKSQKITISPKEYCIEKVILYLQEEKVNLMNKKFLFPDFIMTLELSFDLTKNQDICNLYFSVFSDVFISVIRHQQHAQVFWNLKEQHEIILSEHPVLLNHVAKILGDKLLWIKTLEDAFLKDYRCSEDLMAYYYDSEPENAALFFGTYKHNSYDYLIHKVEKGISLHIEILRLGVLDKEDLNAFEELKKYISDNETKQLINSANNPKLKIKLWNQQQRFDKIEETIEKELKHGAYIDWVEFDKSIRVLYHSNPDAAIRLTERKINLLMTHKEYRNRNTYQYIAGLLKQSFEIPEKEQHVKSIATKLYHNKPNLPALKDEFRKTGLI